MRGVYTIILALAMALPAAAQSLTVPVVGGNLFTPVSDGASVGDEPNVPSGGSFATPHRYGPTSYPPDANGIAEARSGGVPVRVLEMRPTTSSSLDGASETQVAWLLTPFTGQDFVDPRNEFRAVFGDWSDVNGDGVIQNDRWESGDVTGNPAVRGNDFAAGTADEWNGIEVSEFEEGWALVTYQTGFAQPQDTDMLPLINDGFFLGENDGAEPSNRYRGDNGDGYYVSLIGVGLGSTTRDQQFVNTIVSETFIGLQVPNEEQREYAPVPGQPYDVDVYKALDATVEALYVSTLLQFGTAWQGANATAGPILDLADDVPDPSDNAITNPIVGSAALLVFPTFPGEGQDAESNPTWDYTEAWHPRVDALNNYGFIAADLLGLGLSTFEVSPTANGERGVAPGMILPRISHGLWWDRNGDGIVTDSNGEEEEPAAGCPDAYDCGLGGHSTGGDHSEWLGACPTLAPKVRYNTPSGTWGTTGVYIVRDLGTAVDDVRDDAQVDRLVTAGEIVLTATCNADNSPYQSFADDAILFPTGAPDFDVIADTEYCTSIVEDGIKRDECTTDRDVLKAFAS